MFRLLQLSCVSALLIASILPSWALAQATDDPWDLPLNVSHSGGTVNPAIVIDSAGIVHTVWQDNFANYVYTQFDGDQWSVPETTALNRLFRIPVDEDAPRQSEVPLIYTGANPLFLAGPAQHVFAVWISTQGSLLTSKVENQDFRNIGRWDSGRVIARDAASFAATVDASGELHLTYIRTVGDPLNPAGLYYMHTKNSGSTLTAPVLLYESPYLRTLAEGEANLSIATAGTEDARRVYLAWDNRPRKQVFLMQSADGGKSWDQPRLVAGPAPYSGLSGPFNIRVGATSKSVVLVWQDGQPEITCTQFYQSSSDAGATWSDPQPMTDDLPGCAQSNEFVPALANGPNGLLFFLTESKTQSFLIAWNGLQWSQPQEQPILSGFEEPEIYTEVIYGCHRASLFGKRLYVAGCDEGVGGDVWVTSRDLGSNASWSTAPAWSPLSPIASDNLEIETMELVATEDGLIHAFFNQHQDPSIYYAYWDGELWSGITPVLKVPEGDAGWPLIAARPGNELFLIARNNVGALYFSRATSGSAARQSRWSTPTRLGIGFDGEIGSMDSAWDAAGTVYVAYSIPVNEERGIYLVQSQDNGTSWSEPVQVLNGAAAGFDLVGTPSLLTAEDGFLHIIWKEQSIQGDGVPQPHSLYYARSEDGGRTFSSPELVVDEPVSWQDIVTDGEGNLHLLWQSQDQITTVWDQISLDGGRTWQTPQGLHNVGTIVAVTVDSAGNLHLVDAEAGSLDHWVWGGSRWRPEAPLQWSLPSQQERPAVGLLSSVVSKEGELVVVLAVPTGEGDSGEMNLFYSMHALDQPPGQTAIQDVPTQTLLPSTLTPATSTPDASATPEASSTEAGAVTSEPTNSQGQTDGSETSNPISPFAVAVIPVALLLFSVLGIMIRRATQAKDR